MKVRLKDVAARAGVAVNTASTILNRRPNSWASKETEARVFAAAESLGYKPNRAALGLRSGRFNTLGLLLPDLHNAFYTTFADLLDQEAEARGYDLIVESWRNTLERERHCLEDLSDRQIDGMASFLSDNHTHLEFLEGQFRKKRPFVALSAASGTPLPVDAVFADFSQGMRMAVDRLYQYGHRQFAFLCALAKGQVDGNRPELLHRFLTEKGVSSLGFDFVRCDPQIESAYQATLSLLASGAKPTALIALNDLSAMGAMRALTERGFRIPQDISVVGVDDIPLGRYLPVTLSTIAQPLVDMARKTAELLISRIENPNKAHLEQVVFPASFVARESIGPAPIRAGASAPSD